MLPRSLHTLLLCVVVLGLVAPCAEAASPSPPTSLAGKAGDALITLTWKAPVSGTPAVSYRIYAKSVLAGAVLPATDAGQFSGSTAVATVPAGTVKYVLGTDPNWALFNGEPYWVAVRAVDAAGTESTGNPIVSATPYGRPGAPSITRTRAGDGSITVTFGSGETNGSPIIDYTASVGARTCTALAASPTCTVSGLATGTYAVQACSRNAAGTSTACRTSSGIAVTSTAGGGSSDGGASNGGTTTGGGSSSAPATATSASGTATLALAKATILRARRAVTVTARLTTTGISALAYRVSAKAGTRVVATCAATATSASDGVTTLSCRLGAKARTALRGGALVLMITATGSPADGSEALSASRTQRATRG